MSWRIWCRNNAVFQLFSLSMLCISLSFSLCIYVFLFLSLFSPLFLLSLFRSLLFSSLLFLFFRFLLQPPSSLFISLVLVCNRHWYWHVSKNKPNKQIQILLSQNVCISSFNWKQCNIRYFIQLNDYIFINLWWIR